MIKIVIGIAIIVLSFVYILKHRDQSLMDALMGKRRKQMEELEALAAQQAEEESASGNNTTQH